MSQNNANDKSFANMLNIWILQHNCARSTQIMHACMKFAKNKTDIVILQESWMRDENITISHSSFICIKSNVQNTCVRVLIFVAKNAKKFTCTSRSDIVNSEDMQAISIIIIIIHTFLWHWLNRFMRKIYAMCVEWTKLFEV